MVIEITPRVAVFTAPLPSCDDLACRTTEVPIVMLFLVWKLASEEALGRASALRRLAWWRHRVPRREPPSRPRPAVRRALRWRGIIDDRAACQYRRQHREAEHDRRIAALVTTEIREDTHEALPAHGTGKLSTWQATAVSSELKNDRKKLLRSLSLSRSINLNGWVSRANASISPPECRCSARLGILAARPAEGRQVQ